MLENVTNKKHVCIKWARGKHFDILHVLWSGRKLNDFQGLQLESR